MKFLNLVTTAILLSQCTTEKYENIEPSSQAISTALEAYQWGSTLVENGRVIDLNELTTLYGSSADWADEELKAKLAKVNDKLKNYKPGNAADRDKILFIFYGFLPMSRDMSDVSKPQVIEEGAVWKVAISGILTRGIQWNVKSYKVSYHFLISKEKGRFRVKDIIIDGVGSRRTLCQWLDGVVN